MLGNFMFSSDYFVSEIMRSPMVRTRNLGDAGRFSCTWTTSRSLLEELISSYSKPSPPPRPPPASQAPPPMLMLPRMEFLNNGSMLYRFFNPVDEKVRIVEKHKCLPRSACATTSSKGWVTFVDPLDGALYIWDPLSEMQKDVLRLPSVGTLPCVVDIEFAHGSNRIPTTTIREFNIRNLSARHKISCFHLTKLWTMMISGSFSTSPDEDNHCIAMGYHGSPASLHYSKIGGTAWNAMDSPLSEYSQVIASQRKDKLFFALSCCGEIEAWDLGDLSNIKRTLVTEVPRFLSYDICSREIDLNGETYEKKEIEYIVESSGGLLLVTRFIAHYHYPDTGTYDCSNGYYRTIGFVVRRLNFGLNKWETVNYLGGCAIFVGKGSECFSLRACDYSGLEENAIYFASADEIGRYSGWDVGVFYLEDNEVYRYQLSGYKIPDGFMSLTASPFWVAPPSLCPVGSC